MHRYREQARSHKVARCSVGCVRLTDRNWGKCPTTTSESGTLHRWNDEAYSPPVAQKATGFGDPTTESPHQ